MWKEDYSENVKSMLRLIPGSDLKTHFNFSVIHLYNVVLGGCYPRTPELVLVAAHNNLHSKLFIAVAEEVLRHLIHSKVGIVSIHEPNTHILIKTATKLE